MRRLAFGVLLLAMPALGQAQSLGDAARQEKDRREKNAAGGVKAQTVTEEDLKNGKGQLANDPDADAGEAMVPTTTGGTSGPATVGVPGAPPSQAPTAARGESYWRGAHERALARLEGAKEKYQHYTDMVLVPGYYYAAKNGHAQIDSVGQLQGMTARAKGEMDAAQKALDDLEERARRAGVPPGWMR
jgi:hypothetical protein